MQKPILDIDQIIQNFLIILITNDIDWEAKPSPQGWSKKRNIRPFD
ncbi:hypothetical protein [uncultured Mucilaginibacter sp.]|nr:hypothetical protein [uncultured Mucilaginibacter sp.]